MTGARDFTGCAIEFDFQALHLSYCAALKQEYQPLVILRHQRGFPPPSASLIEKISQRILVFSCMACELDHYSLIFLHAATNRG